MAKDRWKDLGAADQWKLKPLQQVEIEGTKIAVSYQNGVFGAISGVCNHVGGPLGDGHLEGEYVVCPWHSWTFHCRTGLGEPGYEDDAVPSHDVKEEKGRLLVNLEAKTKRHQKPHDRHPLERPLVREAGSVRVLGISTTVMNRNAPRYSTSDALLEHALMAAREKLGCETKLIKLNDLEFRPCEGYYSKSAHACTWPCTITQKDSKDQMDQVYEAVVFWADVILVATPIRWGSASSLYYKMIERMNCIQNQITIRNRVLLRNKVASFIVMGGQDNVQAVAGHMMMFFGEIGCAFPPFPFIAHSRGWAAEDMEENIRSVKESSELKEGAGELVARAVDLARILVDKAAVERMARGGRKAHPLKFDKRVGEE